MIRRTVLFLLALTVVPVTVSFLWSPPLLAWTCCCLAWGDMVGKWFGELAVKDMRRRWEQGEL